MTPTNQPALDQDQLEIVSGDALAAIERSQVDMQITTAKKYPRSIKAFLNEAESMIALNQDTAEGCNYRLKRKNPDGTVKYIEGPSIRLMEIAASAYTNLRFGSRIIAIDEDHVTAQGVAIDMQKNIAITVEVKRSIKGKHGRYSTDMIMVTSNAAGSIARRNALLGGAIPRAYITQLAEFAKHQSVGDAKSLPERLQRAFEYFNNSLGIDAKRLLEYLEKPSLQDCSLADLDTLQGLKTALKEGDTTIESEFPVQTSRQSTPDLSAAAEPTKMEAPKEPKRSNKPPTPEPPAPTAEATPAPVPPSSPTPQVGPYAQLQEIVIEGAGVSVDDFMGWITSRGTGVKHGVEDARKFGALSDLPLALAEELAGDTAALAKCIKLYGTKTA